VFSSLDGLLVITLSVKNLSNSIRLVIDSTGVKVYGEGEWKVRQHGVGKRRTRRKFHFGMDEETLKNAILNRMTHLGMLDSVMVVG
jgi:hypothetical protein